MRPINSILIIVFVLLMSGCTKTWDDHFKKQPDTVNMNVWDAIKTKSELSHFTELMVKYKYDTLFTKNNTYSIFAPDNSAFDKYINSQVEDTTLLNYLISRYYVQPVDIQGKRKLQTLAEKFSTFEYVGGQTLFDGIALKYESPLYLNGKFFIMDQVPVPKLNLYQFYIKANPYLIKYINSKDSIVLDQAKSKPIGFDANGNTVYDTVSTKLNLVELKYFAVSKEYRNSTATFVFPQIENYQNALTAMAQKLGGIFNNYNDIPVKWQQDILMPVLLDHGVFLNMLDVSEFIWLNPLYKKKKYNMVNIRGDSIIANYTPTNEYLCSNGVAYDYTSFVIPDSLFSGVEKFEGEWLAIATGANKFGWRKGVTVTSTSYFDVSKQYIKTSVDTVPSNDTILVVNFTKGYKGTYKLQFNVKNLFPRRYRMVVNTNMDIGGIYDVYVNDVLVKTFDYYDYVKYKLGIIPSVTGGKLVPVSGTRFNRFDCYVDNITEYSRPTIRFDYKGPGLIAGNGLVIDDIEFIPAPN